MNQQSCLPSRQQQLYPVIMHQAKNKKSRIKRCVHDPSRATITLFTIFIVATLTSYNQPQHQSSSLFIQAQQQTFSADNPRNRFCGISYKEAHQFCHLPPTQSLPCPSGIDTDCPYKLKCWTIQETCTQSPTTSPTLNPTHAPITRRSNDPTDHYFCGIGFDNLFGCGNACPGGNSAECPSGQLCYFDTPCDARMQGRPPGDEVDDTTADNVEDSNGGGESSVVVQEGEGARNFCGRTIDEAMETCTRDKHCPSGLNGECPDGMYCWSHLPDCNVNEMPTPSPTISPKPTPLPTPEPTTRSPSATESPTSSPLKASEDHFYCGRSWTDATLKCHMRCTEFYNNCPSGEECFNNVPCAGKLSAPPPPKKPPTPSPSGAPFSGTRAPTFSPRPTDKPVATASPTHSPLAKDDMRNYFFCGTSWMDASRRCYKRCVSGHHMECPGDEQCFAQADCKRGLITKKPTPHPTVAPHPGSRSPTVSPAPSVSPTGPQPTESPVPPNNEPTDKPTTPWPTFLPTFAPCQGDPCPNREHCRSKTGYCGAGPAYCNNPSWDASCKVPTNPPVTSPPTSPWPSVHPSMSFEPSSPPPPTRTPSLIPSKAPVVESQNNEPTKEPTGAVDPDEEEFGPDDPRGTFFCGTDWNHAITECPIRCPNGESTECPTDWSCYAFTPCTNVGNIQPPSLKPTWEPTRKPVIRPTRKPIDPQQETTTEPTATAQQEWQQPPSLKPTFKPTGDRCRATPCEDTNQCRSKLGFCGIGIIYCNSESSWEPECDPNFGANGGPSQAPSTLFDAWLEKQPDITATDGSASNVQSNPAMDPVDEVVKEEVEDVTYADFSGDWGSDNDNLGQEKEETGESGSDSQEQEIEEEEEEETGDWGSYSQEKEEEEIEVWWRVKSSSSASRAEIFLFLAALPFAVLLWQ